MAYTVKISPNDSSANQSSPGWMLTFLRWENRDTLHYADKVKPSNSDPNLREPLVVLNDCLSLSVVSSKSSTNSSFQATFVGTDINYSTAVAPGDFCIINIVKYDTQTLSLYDKAKGLNPINGKDDGFKGLFKVQSVRRTLQVSPDGPKHLVYTITGHAFTELNNVIYFSPYIATEEDKQRPFNLFVSNLGDTWKNLILEKKGVPCSDVLPVFLRGFIGESIPEDKRKLKDGTAKTENRQFEIPTSVGKLLGLKNATYAADIYRFVSGIQKYENSNNGNSIIPLEKGLFPTNYLGYPIPIGEGATIPLSDKCEGYCFSMPDLWNQSQAWSIMKQFANTEINELFTCHKLFPNGSILPTIVYRQIPFTTDYFNGDSSTTKFSSLPRWEVDPELILNFDLGRDDAARFNMVQLFGSNALGDGATAANNQIMNGNFVLDTKDIKRHGLKPLITSTQFDLVQTEDPKSFNSPRWAKLRADWLIGGQLKENGHITCIGIQEPICEGDNFKIGSYLFHIESITHSCNAAPNGLKEFRTTLSLCNGVSIKSSSVGPVYDEMDHTDANKTRQEDKDGVYPGIGDVQDIPARVNAEEVEDKKEGSFTLSPSFPDLPNLSNLLPKLPKGLL